MAVVADESRSQTTEDNVGTDAYNCQYTAGQLLKPYLPTGIEKTAAYTGIPVKLVTTALPPSKS
jgi:hypothetical protein